MAPSVPTAERRQWVRLQGDGGRQRPDPIQGRAQRLILLQPGQYPQPMGEQPQAFGRDGQLRGGILKQVP